MNEEKNEQQQQQPEVSPETLEQLSNNKGDD